MRKVGRKMSTVERQTARVGRELEEVGRFMGRKSDKEAEEEMRR